MVQRIAALLVPVVDGWIIGVATKSLAGSPSGKGTWSTPSALLSVQPDSIDSFQEIRSGVDRLKGAHGALGETMSLIGCDEPVSSPGDVGCGSTVFLKCDPAETEVFSDIVTQGLVGK